MLKKFRIKKWQKEVSGIIKLQIRGGSMNPALMLVLSWAFQRCQYYGVL